MKRYLLLLVLLSGCATQAPNPWTDLETDTTPAVTPLDCGKWPIPTEFTDSMIVYDLEGVHALDAYKACSEANAQIASENAKTVDQLKIVRKGLTEAGQSQRNIADMRQEMLEDERKHHFWQSVGYWVLIVGAVAL